MCTLTTKLRMDLSWFNMTRDGPVPPIISGASLIVRVILMALRTESFAVVLLYRLAAQFHDRGHGLLSALLSRTLRRRYGCMIAATAKIGGGLRLPHPYGIVIGGGVRLGEMVTIGQHVTLGANFDKMDSAGNMYPAVGAWSWITAGAVVAGPVKLGLDVTVGANAVVSRDVEDHAIIAGVPAKMLRNKLTGSVGAGARASLGIFHGYSTEVVSRLTPNLA